MKKVGVLTFHFADNFGAVLQCYALKAFLDGLEGVWAEIINYIPIAYQYPVCWESSYQQKLFCRKRKLFEDFLESRCGVKKPVCHKVTGSGFDICCVGSDQVWNVLGGWTEYFFPNVEKGIKKISYAASVGCSTEFLLLRKEQLADYISKFSAISVRERIHVSPITEISGQECECVLDPTLMIDRKNYDVLIGNKKKEYDPYLFFFWLNNDDSILRGIELANMVARKYGLKIIHSVYQDTEKLLLHNAGCMYYEGIEDFLWYIQNASFIVTNSYHGTIFSILYQKPFYVYTVCSMESRIDTLSEDLKLGSRVVNRFIPWEEISEEVDYDEIMECLNRRRRESAEFLKWALYEA